MLTCELPKPYPVEAVDPVLDAPDPGVMGELYVTMRQFYPDGMSLVCAQPRQAFDQIVREYEVQRQQPGFDPREFWDAHFIMPEPDRTSYVDFEVPIDDYTLRIRKSLQLQTPPQPVEHSLDAWVPCDGSAAGVGRFGRHSYSWDDYHQMLGWASDGRWDLLVRTVLNDEYQINEVGFPRNGLAKFYTRPQIPYTAKKVELLAEHFGPEAWIRFRPMLEKEYEQYWMRGREGLAQKPLDGQIYRDCGLVRMPDGSFLNTYWDDGYVLGPRLESYKEDFMLGQLVVQGLKGAVRRKRLSKFYLDIRAAAASGWDFSSRWFADGKNISTINTTDIAPVDLNAMLEFTETALATAYRLEADAWAVSGDEFALNREAECRLKASEYAARSIQRSIAISKYMWDKETRIFRDYNVVERQQTRVVSAAMFYPLFVGSVTVEQAMGVAHAAEHALLYPGGIATTTNHELDNQWEGKERIWAPLNWAAAYGLVRTAWKIMALLENGTQIDSIDPNIIEQFIRLAERIRDNYTSGIEQVKDAHGTITEKHHGEDPTKLTGGGEYLLVKVLGMPVEVYRALMAWNPRATQKVSKHERYVLAA